jgi:hypothetical protein
VSEILCPFCGRPVDPEAPTTARGVWGWGSPVLAIGPLEDVKPTGEYAHLSCVEAAERVAAPRRTGDDP